MPKNLDISAHHCAILTGFIAVSQLETLILCFARMHQVIALVLNTHVVPKFLQYSCYALCVLCPIALCGCIEHFHITQDQQWDYISETYPELIPEFQKLTHFVLYIKSCKLNHLLIAMILSGITLFVIFVVFLFDIFNLMVDLKIRRSTSYYQKHKEAMHSLLVQFVTSSICLVPPFMLVIIVFFEIPNGQLLSEMFIAWFVSHSSINMIGLIIFFPPYQIFFLRVFKRKNSKHTTPVAVVPVVAAVSSGF
ncbi:Protein CBG19486 [Caenorhabditis briggsae]|uniref:Protein CBG19486 n=1 Tax=Caenorhabditis briggsae TaxID=6238 RepID=A8XVQ5_CAEBR|nr:Protein CBG19486 [Caenorhabditis briggsae]CAP36724.2 Protein CBG19486 [Caenorhabditis briggsae]